MKVPAPIHAIGEWFTRFWHTPGIDGRIESSIGDRSGEPHPGDCLEGDDVAEIDCSAVTGVLTAKVWWLKDNGVVHGDSLTYQEIDTIIQNVKVGRNFADVTTAPIDLVTEVDNTNKKIILSSDKKYYGLHIYEDGELFCFLSGEDQAGAALRGFGLSFPIAAQTIMFTTDEDVPYNIFNELGGSYQGAECVPINLLHLTQDSLGNTLDYKGKLRLPIQLKKAWCLLGDGTWSLQTTHEPITVTVHGVDVTADVTITDNGDGTWDTLFPDELEVFNLYIDDVCYPVSNGSGNEVGGYDSTGTSSIATIVAGTYTPVSIWQRQDQWFWNFAKGFDNATAIDFTQLAIDALTGVVDENNPIEMSTSNSNTVSGHLYLHTVFTGTGRHRIYLYADPTDDSFYQSTVNSSKVAGVYYDTTNGYYLYCHNNISVNGTSYIKIDFISIFNGAFEFRLKSNGVISILVEDNSYISLEDYIVDNVFGNLSVDPNSKITATGNDIPYTQGIYDWLTDSAAAQAEKDEFNALFTLTTSLDFVTEFFPNINSLGIIKNNVGFTSRFEVNALSYTIYQQSSFTVQSTDSSEADRKSAILGLPLTTIDNIYIRASDYSLGEDQWLEYYFGYIEDTVKKLVNSSNPENIGVQASREFHTQNEAVITVPECPQMRAAGFDPTVEYTVADLQTINNNKIFIGQANGRARKLVTYGKTNTEIITKAEKYVKS